MFDFHWSFLESMTGTEMMPYAEWYDADIAYCAGCEL